MKKETTENGYASQKDYEESMEEKIKHLDEKDNDGFYRCVYCFCKIDYKGSCDVCGYKEDRALGKVD